MNKILELSEDMAVIRHNYKPIPKTGELEMFVPDVGFIGIVYRSHYEVSPLSPDDFKKEVHRVYGE